MTLIIRDEEAKNLLTCAEALEALEDAYRQYGLGLAGGNSLVYGSSVIPRCEMRVEGRELPHLSARIRGINQSMAYLEETGMAVVRLSFNLGNRTGMADFLINAKSGEIVAVLKAPHVWYMRLGAEGAIGSKYLSRKDSKIAGMIGTGRAGRALLEAIANVRNIEKVYAHAGREADRPIAQEYAKEMSKKLGIEIVVCGSAEEVVRNVDILTTATMATQPIVKGDWVNEGLHINAIGADDPLKAELDAFTLLKADKLVIDYQLSLETKEIRVPMEQGMLKPENIYGHIGEVVAGIKPGRESSSEITIFKNTGMTLPYVTIYKKVYANAIKKGMGTEADKDYLEVIYS